MREIVRITQQGSCVCMYKYKIVYVCVNILYKGMHFEVLFFYHKPVVVIKQLVFNLTHAMRAI